MKRPSESDYTSLVAYTRALEEYCDAKHKLVGLTALEMEGLYQSATYMDETDFIHMLMMAEDKLKEKNQ